MTHLKSLTTIFLLTLCLRTFGQTKLPTEKVIRKTFITVFKDSKEAGYKSTRWSACNLDSAFYKNDTINLISDESYYLNNGCCKIADLVFSSKSKCSLQNVDGCQLISKINIGKGSNVYKVSFSTELQFAIIIFTNNVSNEQMKFKIISMDKIIPYYKDLITIKLVRINKA